MEENRNVWVVRWQEYSGFNLKSREVFFQKKNGAYKFAQSLLDNRIVDTQPSIDIVDIQV
jgi:hypothetical protein